MVFGFLSLQALTAAIEAAKWNGQEEVPPAGVIVATHANEDEAKNSPSAGKCKHGQNQSCLTGCATNETCKDAFFVLQFGIGPFLITFFHHLLRIAHLACQAKGRQGNAATRKGEANGEHALDSIPCAPAHEFAQVVIPAILRRN